MSPSISAQDALAREVMSLRQHIAWLNGTLGRLADLQVLASTIDPSHELAARIAYARTARAASLGRFAELGSHDRPPSLSALIVGQALARPAAEQVAIDVAQDRTAATGKPLLSVLTCDFWGRISVQVTPTNDDLQIAAGLPHLLWHWIEEHAVRGVSAGVPTWFVPGFCANASLAAKSDAARAFAAALERAGRSIEALLAPPDGALS